jgi:hypothetical protein
VLWFIAFCEEKNYPGPADPPSVSARTPEMIYELLVSKCVIDGCLASTAIQIRDALENIYEVNLNLGQG